MAAGRRDAGARASPAAARFASAPLATAAAAALFSVVLFVFAAPARAVNLQTVNLCNCLTPACTLDIPGAGGTLACFVNITSCSYFLQAEPKNDLFRPRTIHVDDTGRAWDYCQAPFSDQTKKGAPPALASIRTIEGCKCLKVFYTAYGRRYEDSCSDSVTSRAPFCYVWPPSCPEAANLQRSSFYPGYFTGFCQAKERPEPAETRTRLGCRCLREYRYFEDKIKDGKCTTGRTQLAGKKFCYVDPSSCEPGRAKPSALYEGWFFDQCD